MTHTKPNCPDDAKMNAGRRHGIQLAYDGVMAAYIRDIARGAEFEPSRPGRVPQNSHLPSSSG